MNSPGWAVKWRAAIRVAKERGWTFHVHDESRIRDGVLRNIQSLQRYTRTRPQEHEIQRIMETIRAAGTATAHHLVGRCPAGDEPGSTLAQLWHLVASRRLDCDMSRPLDLDTELWVSTR